MKRLILVLLALVCLFPFNAFSQCEGGRYKEPVFSNINLSPEVPYGQNTNVYGVPQPLAMDIYEPLGDSLEVRPLIIWAFGGSFTYGDKKSPDIVQLCQAFAQRGYVCAAIDYRLGFESLPPTQEMAVKAVIRGIHDGKAAVRFFRKNAGTYKIDTNKIIFGGVSAGAFIALHNAFVDRAEELADYYDINTMGGIEGESGNPGFSSKAVAVVNLCGALGRASWMEEKDLIPVYSMHGDKDGTVPYGHDFVSLNGDPIIEVDGSYAIDTFAKKKGFTNHQLYTFYGAGHVPFVPMGPVIGNTPDTAGLYMDTVITNVTAFLAKEVIKCSELTSVSSSSDKKEEVILYPNPNRGNFTIQLKGFNWHQPVHLNLIDITGQNVWSKKTNGFERNIRYSNDDAKKGMYLLRVQQGKIQVLKRVVIID